MNKEKYTGCTLHVVNKKIDGGRILLQKQCEVLTEDPEILKKQVQELEKDCIVEYINRYTSSTDSGINAQLPLMSLSLVFAPKDIKIKKHPSINYKEEKDNEPPTLFNAQT